ncbi:hypothetical protein BCR36DRAFT_580070 [Piromyces finnis]|uniref:RING-type domain-containing protein n=1 Tax=Piromyces finnis TaxID=1754191 RepID=A0A1Y1VK50_9FUNG|nr:hypothetical protein BCR36DRAFT_580070 [Piromyces finnis]|eukprot:ORX58461.1 hypothetical protein BCR36DRAFT_580070 [Piromyces finnis]
MEFENNNDDNISNSKVVTTTTKKNVIINNIDNSHSIIEYNSIIIPEIIKQETTTITTKTTIKKKKKRQRKTDVTEQNNNDSNELCDISFTSIYSTTSSISSISNDLYSASFINNSSIEELPINYNPYNTSHNNHILLNNVQVMTTKDNISELLSNTKKGKEKEIDISDINEKLSNSLGGKISPKHLSFSENTSKNSFNIISSKINENKNNSKVTETNRLSVSINSNNGSNYNTSTCSLSKYSNANVIENKQKMKKNDNMKLKRNSNISEININYFERNAIPFNRHSLAEGTLNINNVTDFNALTFLKESHLANFNDGHSFTQNSPIKKINTYKTCTNSVIQNGTLENDIICQHPYYLNKDDFHDIYSIMNHKASMNKLHTINKMNNRDAENRALGKESLKGKGEMKENKERASNFGFIQRAGYTKPEGLEPWIEKSAFNLEKEKCSICFEGFKDESCIPFMLVCQHYFHFECIFKWCCQEDNSKCPLCRETIDKNCIFEDIIFEFDTMDENNLCYSTILPELNQEISTTSTTTLTHSQTKTTRSTTSSKYPINEHSFTSSSKNLITPSSTASSISSPIYSTLSLSSCYLNEDKVPCTPPLLPVKETLDPPSNIKYLKDNDTDNACIMTTYSYINLKDINNADSNTAMKHSNASLYNPSIHLKTPESKYSLPGLSITHTPDLIPHNSYDSIRPTMNRFSFISLQNISSNLDKTEMTSPSENGNSHASQKNFTKSNVRNTSSTSIPAFPSILDIPDKEDLILNSDTTDITLYPSNLSSTSHQDHSCISVNENTLNPNNIKSTIDQSITTLLSKEKDYIFIWTKKILNNKKIYIYIIPMSLLFFFFLFILFYLLL